MDCGPSVMRTEPNRTCFCTIDGETVTALIAVVVLFA